MNAPNGGQTVKEFLRAEGIKLAARNDSNTNSVRRKRKRLQEGVPFPMHRPSEVHKKKLADKLELSEFIQGSEVVPSTVHSFSLDKTTNTISEMATSVTARKIPLLEIRKKLLQQHEGMGLIRRYADFDLPREELMDKLVRLGEQLDPLLKYSDMQDLYKQKSLTRHFKIWHDHSTVDGHGHFLVLVSAVYDPAFYFTALEMKEKFDKNIDIQSVVEVPEIHILARSSSSLDDQAKYNACRGECLKELTTKLKLSSGDEVTDVARFFHGDGPAQQFESGNTIGGNYSCVGCGARSDRFDDVAYTYRCPAQPIAERPQFLLKGHSWKNIKNRPLDKLLLADLQKELRVRGYEVQGKKPAIEKKFEELRMGISNFPALLQENPQAPLSTLNLERYEISPTEPLHDLKGHFSNIIEESTAISVGKAHDAIVSVKQTILSKDTIRCSDVRKAVIVIYSKLKQVDPSNKLTELFRTTAEIAKLCYAQDSERTPRAVLCLHNRTFLHASLCCSIFSNPETQTRKKLFGRYFHSLIHHAAMMFRLVHTHTHTHTHTMNTASNVP